MPKKSFTVKHKEKTYNVRAYSEKQAILIAFMKFRKGKPIRPGAETKRAYDKFAKEAKVK